jgi:hypothetical protein
LFSLKAGLLRRKTDDPVRFSYALMDGLVPIHAAELASDDLNSRCNNLHNCWLLWSQFCMCLTRFVFFLFKHHMVKYLGVQNGKAPKYNGDDKNCLACPDLWLGHFY